MRPEDTVARLGGDEFTVLLEDIADVRYAIGVAERIEESLREPFPIDGHEATVTASIGIAVSSGRESTPEDLLRNSDQAMYQAKRKGRARHELFAVRRPRAEDRAPVEVDESRRGAAEARRGGRCVIEHAEAAPLDDGDDRGAGGGRCRRLRRGARRSPSRPSRSDEPRDEPQEAPEQRRRARLRSRRRSTEARRRRRLRFPRGYARRAPAPRFPPTHAGCIIGRRRCARSNARAMPIRSTVDGWVPNRNRYSRGRVRVRDVRQRAAAAPAR